LRNSAKQKTCGSEEEEDEDEKETTVLLYRRSTEFSSSTDCKGKIDTETIRQNERREKVVTLSIDNLLKIYKENPEKMESIFSIVKSLDAEKDPERFLRLCTDIQ